VLLWGACRAGMGNIAHRPDAGRMGDRAGLVVETPATLVADEAGLDVDGKHFNGRL
jgi:hypothetical protein